MRAVEALSLNTGPPGIPSPCLLLNCHIKLANNRLAKVDICSEMFQNQAFPQPCSSFHILVARTREKFY